MHALDLFCGAGGAGKGIQEAGFNVTGVDYINQSSYPSTFIQEDVLNLSLEYVSSFDFIWASPPCQAFSFSSACRRNSGYEYEDYLVETRWLLKESGKPYIIENVVGAPLIEPITLCGTMFDLKVFRHRVFESNMPIICEYECKHKGNKAKERRNDNGNFFTVAGHHVGTLKEWSDAMGIDFMKNKAELAQSIPPAYSKYLSTQIKDFIVV